MSALDPLEQTFNWFSDRNLRLWPLTLLSPLPGTRFEPGQVLGLSLLTAGLAVALVTALRLATGLPISAFATAGISLVALVLCSAWFALAAWAWNRREDRRGRGIEQGPVSPRQ